MKAKEFYLSFYNRVNIIGWLLIFLLNITDQEKCCQFLVFFQSLMLMDIVHALFKLIPTKPFIALIQVLSRIYLISIFFNNYPSSCVFWRVMILAWSSAEIIRYQYYAFKKFKQLRYSAFLVLYPVGVCLGEIPLIYLHFNDNPHFYLDLLVLLTYLPGFPYLFNHMLKARKRALKSKSN